MSKNWVICVGINGYYSLKPLKYAQRDAEAMRGFCQESRFEEIYFFGEGAAPIEQGYGPPLRAEPTFGNLDRFLDIRFREPFLEAGDNLWFFFAGHGRRHANRDYLMPIDGNPGKVERTGLAISDIADRLRGCGADNIILMLDACRGEDDRDGGEGIGVEQQQGVITLFSCSPSELSYEIDELQQGAFTHALLQGLRLQGEGNCATVERLYQHLRYQVPALNQRYKKQRQTPYAIAEPATKLHLILLPDRATLQDVQALKVDALEAEAETALDLAEQLWVRVLVASPGDRQAVKALKRIGRLSAQQLAQSRHQSEQPSASTISQGSRTTTTQLSDGAFRELQRETPLDSSSLSPVQLKQQVEHVVQLPAQPLARQAVDSLREELGQGIALELVKVPSGCFQMGSWQSRAWPPHEVTISSFLMGKYPVTQAQWRAVCALPKVLQELTTDPPPCQRGNRPVEQVSWNESVEFCQRLSQHSGREYRLPSEAEWEYACRAGTAMPLDLSKAVMSFDFGETIVPFNVGKTLMTDLANYRGTDLTDEGKNYLDNYNPELKGEYRGHTTDVGSFPANGFGLHDMHGNVWEWCLDHWHESYSGAPTDGSAWTESEDDSLRVLRGGSWYYDPDYCRSADRNWLARDNKELNYGFRVVCAAS